MDWTSADSIPYFKEASAVAEGFGLVLVELNVIPQKGSVRIETVIALKDISRDIGVNDCANIHRSFIPLFAQLTGRTEDEIYMEVGSPGLDRKLKDAREFQIFQGSRARVFDKEISDWTSGIIRESDQTQVTLELEDGSCKTVAYNNIAKAKFINF